MDQLHTLLNELIGHQHNNINYDFLQTLPDLMSRNTKIIESGMITKIENCFPIKFKINNLHELSIIGYLHFIGRILGKNLKKKNYIYDIHKGIKSFEVFNKFFAHFDKWNKSKYYFTVFGILDAFRYRYGKYHYFISESSIDSDINIKDIFNLLTQFLKFFPAYQLYLRDNYKEIEHRRGNFGKRFFAPLYDRYSDTPKCQIIADAVCELLICPYDEISSYLIRKYLWCIDQPKELQTDEIKILLQCRKELYHYEKHEVRKSPYITKAQELFQEYNRFLPVELAEMLAQQNHTLSKINFCI